MTQGSDLMPTPSSDSADAGGAPAVGALNDNQNDETAEVVLDDETGEPDPDVLKDLERERSCVFEERLEAGKARRLEGNAAFQAGDLEGALRLYRKSLYHSRFDELQYNYELMDAHRALVDKETGPCYLNMAAVELRLEAWGEAARHCSEVLKREPQNTKALFRRSKANQGKEWWNEAEADMRQCTLLDPEVQCRPSSHVHYAHFEARAPSESA